jgi:uroporphyrinogen III methyltransferase/synthase
MTPSLEQPTGSLANRLVLVTRAAQQSASFSQALQAQGAQVQEMPTLEIGPPSSWQALDQAIVALPRFQWLILTSVNGVEAFFQRLAHLEHTQPDLGQGAKAHLPALKIAVVGQKTAQALERYGLTPTFMPAQFVADALVTEFPEPLADCTVLFPRVESGGRDVLVQAFRAAGAQLTEVPAYESRCPQTLDPAALAAIDSGRVNVITFASSKTVSHFAQLLGQAFGETWRDKISTAAIASIGPQTTKTCLDRLGRVDIEAPVYTLDGLTAAIVTYFSPKEPL